MKGETHIRCGDFNLFCRVMQEHGVEKQQHTTAGLLHGLRIIEDERVPKDRAFLVGPDGKVIETYNLPIN